MSKFPPLFSQHGHAHVSTNDKAHLMFIDKVALNSFGHIVREDI